MSSSWRAPPLPSTTHSLGDVWGSSDHDVWSVGELGRIARHNGQAWQAEGIDVTSQPLRGVWASSGSNAWAVGAAGTILHYAP